MPNFLFHGGGAYFGDTHSRTVAYDEHFLMVSYFPNRSPITFCTKIPVCMSEGMKIK